MASAVREKLHNRIFQAVHRRNLLYNTCWEDPALDRVALNLSSKDRLLVITSAGCNALDYLLAGCGEVHTVDMNPIQNALLEFKRAAILGLNHSDFFELFGEGKSPRAKQMYRDAIRPALPRYATDYWDRHIYFFSGKGWRDSFFFRGTSGLVARLVSFNLLRFGKLRPALEAMIQAPDLATQESIYRDQIARKLWTPWMKWFLKQRLTMTLLGVPGRQLEQITTQYEGGLYQFIKDRLEHVLIKLPLNNNYFWRVYLEGRYTTDCCPEYLKAHHFDKLRSLMGQLHIHTGKVTDVVKASEVPFSRYVLLDHMDWMSHHDPVGLADEWTALLEKATAGARALFRSAGLKVEFLDNLEVVYNGQKSRLGNLIKSNVALANELHDQDRVNTYGSFHIVDLPA